MKTNSVLSIPHSLAKTTQALPAGDKGYQAEGQVLDIVNRLLCQVAPHGRAGGEGWGGGVRGRRGGVS